MHGTRLAVAAAAGLTAGLLLATGPLVGSAHAAGGQCAGPNCVAPPPSVSPLPAPPSPAPTTATTAAQPTTTTTAQPPPTAADARLTLLADLNRERAAAGVPPFTERSDLDAIAIGWSAHLADAGTLSHNEDYFTPSTRQQLDGWALGENVACAGSPDDAHRALMASPAHRTNILDTRFTVVGLGAERREGTWWVTEDFLQPAGPGSAVEASPAPGQPVDTARFPQPVVAIADDPPASLPAPPDAARDTTAIHRGPRRGLSVPTPADETPTSDGVVPPVDAGRSRAKVIGPALAVALALAGWIALGTASRRQIGRARRPLLP